MKKYKYFLKSLEHKSVIFLGYGISNRAIHKFINNYCIDITIYDDKINNKNKFNNVIIQNNINNLLNKKYDYIFRSPSFLPTNYIIQKLNIDNTQFILTEVELFMQLCESNNIIGITGSDGKTTTSTLIYKILKYNNYQCYLGGNIGIPLINEIQKINYNDIIVLELSSFQLMNMKISPNISVITNITENHLDVHTSLDEYINAKMSIIKYQSINDKMIINYLLIPIVQKHIKINNDNILKFGLNERKIKNYLFVNKDNNIIFYDNNLKKINIFNLDNVKIRGSHNIENILAAILATYKYCNFKNIKNILLNFTGVEHRLEYIKTINNVSFYNDSIATTPTRSIAALKTFNKKIILLIGGYDKNLSYKSIIPYILLKVKILILMGKTGVKINHELSKVIHSIKIYNSIYLEEAVKIAYQEADKNIGDIILLSPASASFDQFKNFEERGIKFKQIVNLLL